MGYEYNPYTDPNGAWQKSRRQTRAYKAWEQNNARQEGAYRGRLFRTAELRQEALEALRNPRAKRPGARLETGCFPQFVFTPGSFWGADVREREVLINLSDISVADIFKGSTRHFALVGTPSEVAGSLAGLHLANGQTLSEELRSRGLALLSKL